MLANILVLLIICLAGEAARKDGTSSMQLPIPKNIQPKGDVGEALYLTPFIETGDILLAQELANVSSPLPGIDPDEQPDSYSGFITVDASMNSNMFFWFFPAMDVDPAEAPLVVWLQGGPGGSSMFGLLELHGPISAEKRGNTGTLRSTSWAKRANMIYIDNPVGAGYSYSNYLGLPRNQKDFEIDLYEFLLQWFELFPQYKGNEFHIFGESFAGRWVPSIGRKIHDENKNLPGEKRINLVGLGVGNGFMSPVDTAVYADLHFQVGLIEEGFHQKMLGLEDQIKTHALNGQWKAATKTWRNLEFSLISATGCNYFYRLDLCDTDPEEEDYSRYMQLDSVRRAVHVGSRPFGQQSGLVFNLMQEDFMKSSQEDVEFLLDRYRFLIYNGNMDIICNHNGILNMFAKMETWSDIGLYHNTSSTIHRVHGKVAGYLKSVGNLRLMSIRNAGHYSPRNQPDNILDVFTRFVENKL